MQLPLQSFVAEAGQALANENALIQQLNQYVGAIFNVAGAPVGGNASDTTTDVMASGLVTAGFLQLPGRRLRMTAYGTFAGNAHVKTVAWVLTGSNVTVSTITATSASNAGVYKAELDICDNSNYAATPTFSQSYFGTFNLAGTISNVSGNLTLATTAGITVAVAGSTNTAAASDVACTFFGGEILK